MRRLAAILTVVLVAGAAAATLGASSSSGAGSPYQVRAVFDDAAFAVPGEDVRIAGASVGSIQSLDVCTSSKAPCPVSSPENKAAITLQINDSRFTPFHANATCSVRPQSLIGEKFVDCNPGTAATPELAKIEHGPGTGSYYLPVTRTSSPIDTDIVQNISQQPVRESLTLILNELGTGLAARGSDLNEVIHRANPALGYTDQVFKILARQNRELAQLAKDSDAVLQPLAADRHALANFIVHANTTSTASATQASAIQQTFRLFPQFLRQLRPLMADLGTLAGQGTPLLQSLGQSATALNQQFTNLTPFAGAARKALIDLGLAAAASQPYLLATVPLAKQLDQLGSAGLPSSTSLDRLTASLNQTGGIEQLMRVLFFGTAAGNGFDSLGHYVRDEPLVSSCTNYATTAVPGCSSNFSSAGAAADIARAAQAARIAAVKPTRRSPGRRPSRPARRPARDNTITTHVAMAAAQSAGNRPRPSSTLNELLDYLIRSGR